VQWQGPVTWSRLVIGKWLISAPIRSTRKKRGRQVTRAINLQLKGHQCIRLQLNNGKESFAGQRTDRLEKAAVAFNVCPTLCVLAARTMKNTNGLFAPSTFPKGPISATMTVFESGK